MYKLFFYVDKRGHIPVQDFIQNLNKKSQAKIGRYLKLLKQHGPHLLRPYADHVKDKIKELRIRTTDGNIRIFYFFFMSNNIIMLHAFKKKTQLLPQQEIKKAETYRQNFLKRYENDEFFL